MNEQYSSVDEFFKKYNENRKKQPIKYFIVDSYNTLVRFFWYNPQEFYREVKWVIQRGMRGYADCDSWDIGCYLSSIIVPMVQNLKENGHGLPTWIKGKNEEQAEKEWNDILDDIIFAWEARQKICETEWFYVIKKTRKKYEKTFQTKDGFYIMTKEECERYRRGMRLFIKHLNSLWD